MFTPSVSHTFPRASRFTVAVVLVACGTLAACSSTSTRNFQEARPYPAGVSHTGVVDVQVVRDGTGISAANTSGKSFADARMWVNRRFSRAIGEWKAGDRIALDLREFYDQHGDPFRAGGFFATRRPDPVVIVEVEHGATVSPEMTGLVVVKGEAE